MAATVIVLVCLGMGVVLLFGWLPTGAQPGAHQGDQPPPRGTGGASTDEAGRARTEKARCDTALLAHRSALTVISGWDRRRALAWAAGKPRAVVALYGERSPAGRADAAALTRWRGRGWRIEGMERQISELKVRTCRPEAIEVAISDRLAGAVAVRQGEQVPLPRGQLRRHVLTWQHTDRGWRLAAARPAG